MFTQGFSVLGDVNSISTDTTYLTLMAPYNIVMKLLVMAGIASAPEETPAEPQPVVKADLFPMDENVSIFLGAGCFWHYQHEFVEAERKILNRTDEQLTSLTGYGGSTKQGTKGEVCYHNA